METTTLVYRISQLSETAKGFPSLRLGMYFSRQSEKPVSLAHIDLGGSHFSSGLPLAVIVEKKITWLADRPKDAPFASVKINFSGAQCSEILGLVQGIEEIIRPSVDRDGVPRTSYQLHVTLNRETGVSAKDGEGVFSHWHPSDIADIKLVKQGEEGYLEPQHTRIDSKEVWEMLGCRFEELGSTKEALKGEAARSHLAALMEGKTLSRNARRRAEKQAKKPQAEGVPQELDY